MLGKNFEKTNKRITIDDATHVMVQTGTTHARENNPLENMIIRCYIIIFTAGFAAIRV